MGLPIGYTLLVDGTHCHPRGGRPKETCLENLGFLFDPTVRSKVFPGQGYAAPPAPKCLTQNVFLMDELSYQDMQQQPFLLTVAYAWGLQYWADRLNLPVDPDFCPLVRSVLELRERVKEHTVFSKQDVSQGLGRIDPGTTSWWPQPTPTDLGRVDSGPAGAWEMHVNTSPIIWIHPWKDVHNGSLN